MLHTGMMWYAQIHYRYVSLDWMCLWNDERVKSKQKNIQKMLQEKWEKRTPASDIHNRVGTTASPTTIKAYILREILYAESKVERKSLWLKMLGKKFVIY